ncbi:hypothetical protein PAXRUDRAFT_160828 [Paxillus rubicundulus Ve08.2h10]|uniref:DDE Tnp4 domain-containing protein n=1 Tax=Paxillus rubicundulus Ve08.2h10 TaxID=930991 RepID=A0A0D0CVX8_9AGAM|nr:hypothetical protein PAXRUDRAFT_160828 [Paxillus rubicundulus Ve08.2h10]
MKVSQLILLDHFADHCPGLFRKKLQVDPDIFDAILAQISDHSIFSSASHNHQFPIAIQLVIFLNCAGYYGNVILPEDVAQWARASVGSVVNCTNCVMVAVLDQHDDFIQFPALESQDAENARSYVEAHVCSEWQNGFLAADGSAFGLYAKPGFHGETFFDHKSNYSLNCQVNHFCIFFG